MKIKLDVRDYAGPNVVIDPHGIVWPNKVMTFFGPHADLRADFATAVGRVHETRRWMATLDLITPEGVVIYRVPRPAFWRKPAGWSADIRRNHEGKLQLVGILAIPKLRAKDLT
jgi:hypothetical protein